LLPSRVITHRVQSAVSCAAHESALINQLHQIRYFTCFQCVNMQPGVSSSICHGYEHHGCSAPTDSRCQPYTRSQGLFHKHVSPARGLRQGSCLRLRFCVGGFGGLDCAQLHREIYESSPRIYDIFSGLSRHALKLIQRNREYEHVKITWLHMCDDSFSYAARINKPSTTCATIFCSPVATEMASEPIG
jgi:hypothetical protein